MHTIQKISRKNFIGVTHQETKYITTIKKILNYSTKTLYAIDNSKIQNELNWFPSVSFEEGLKELI